MKHRMALGRVISRKAVLTVFVGVLFANGLGVSEVFGADAAGPDLWRLKKEKNAFDDTTSLTATTTRNFSNGGMVFVEASCGENDLSFDFEYHAKSEKNSYLDTPVLRYRADKGEIVAVNGKANHRNEAAIDFGFDPQFAMSPSGESPGQQQDRAINKATYNLAFPGLPQDLRLLLRAHEFRFEITVDGGISEVVSFNPQSQSFQFFVHACHLELASMDASVATAKADQAAAQKAEEDKKKPPVLDGDEVAAAKIRETELINSNKHIMAMIGYSIMAREPIVLHASPNGEITGVVAKDTLFTVKDEVGDWIKATDQTGRVVYFISSYLNDPPPILHR